MNDLLVVQVFVRLPEQNADAHLSLGKFHRQTADDFRLCFSGQRLNSVSLSHPALNSRMIAALLLLAILPFTAKWLGGKLTFKRVKE